MLSSHVSTNQEWRPLESPSRGLQGMEGSYGGVIPGAAALGAAFAAFSTDSVGAAFLSIGMSLIVIMSTRSRSRCPGWPQIWIAASLGLMFVLHPAAVLAGGRLNIPFHGTGSIVDGYAEAIGLGALLCGGIAFGFSQPGAFWRGSRQAVPRDVSNTAMVGFAMWVTLLAGSLYTAYLVTSGAGIGSISKVGLNTVGASASTAYLYLAPLLLVPAALLLLLSASLTVSKANRRRWRVAAFLLTTVLVVGYLPTGSRIYILLAAAPYLMAFRWLTGRGYSGIQVSVMASVAIVGILALRDTTPGNGPLENLRTVVAAPSTSLQTFATGADTEMVDGLALAVQVVPDAVAHAPGSSLYTTLLGPIPRGLWPEKPVRADGRLNSYLFGAQGVRATDASVAYSIAGSFYLDLGAPGVVLGAWLLGVALAYLQGLGAAAVAHADGLTILIVAAAVPLIPVLLRGTLDDTAARALFVIGPLLYARRFTKRRPLNA